MLRVAGWLSLLVAGCVTPGMEMDREYARYVADGRRTYAGGAFEESRQHFEAALKLRPGDPHLLYNLGRCAEGLGKAKEAEDLYSQALQRDTNHAEARQARTTLLFTTGRRDEAKREVQAWLADQPARAAPYVEDGWLRLQDGDLDSARARFQQALDFDPRCPRALAELGKVYERLGHADRAVVLYRRSLDSDRDQPDLRQRLATLKNVAPPRPD